MKIKMIFKKHLLQRSVNDYAPALCFDSRFESGNLHKAYRMFVH